MHLRRATWHSALVALLLSLAAVPARAQEPEESAADRALFGRDALGWPRFRFGAAIGPGLSLVEGAAMPGTFQAGFFTRLDVRAGVQLDAEWSVYYQASALGGVQPGLSDDYWYTVPTIGHLSAIVGELFPAPAMSVSFGGAFAYAMQRMDGDPQLGGGAVLRVGWVSGAFGRGAHTGGSTSLDLTALYMRSEDRLNRDGIAVFVTSSFGVELF